MLKLVDLKPVIIALSSQIDEITLKRTEESGFDRTFSCPLSVDNLRQEILPMVIQRSQKMKKKYLLLKYYDLKKKKSKESGIKK